MVWDRITFKEVTEIDTKSIQVKYVVKIIEYLTRGQRPSYRVQVLKVSEKKNQG